MHFGSFVNIVGKQIAAWTATARHHVLCSRSWSWAQLGSRIAFTYLTMPVPRDMHAIPASCGSMTGEIMIFRLSCQTSGN